MVCDRGMFALGSFLFGLHCEMGFFRRKQKVVIWLRKAEVVMGCVMFNCWWCTAV